MEDGGIGVFWIFIFLFFVVCGFIAATYQQKHAGKAFFTGFALGPMGIVLVMLFEFGKCSYCGFRIAEHAKICPGCYNDIFEIRLEDGYVFWPCGHCYKIVKMKSDHAQKKLSCPSCKCEVRVPDPHEIGEKVTLRKTG